ncbi:MAG TPA: thioredoxin-disulfide reductase, partial [Clostridia bacterium]|nr:thioredoxin-disulfide reductase [Clostridia bacterium]
GGGPAGITAGIYAERAGLNVLLIERGAPGGQVLTTEVIENYPGFPKGVNGPEMASRMFSQLENLGTEIMYSNVNGVEPEGSRYIVNTDKERIRTRTVILATGAEPVRLNVVGENSFLGKGVSYCATCDGAFFSNKKVAVVGGGDAAIEESIFLSKIVEKVYVIHRRGELRATKILQQRAMDNPKIGFFLHYVVDKVQGQGKVESISIKDVRDNTTKDIAVDGVFIYVGTRPNSELLSGLVEMNKGGYVLSDARMHTSLPGIFVAGDVRLKPLRQVVTAVADGAIATESALRYIEENN